ncbi:dihydroxyacetone kinase subunit DhaK [Sphingomonas oryzagri]
MKKVLNDPFAYVDEAMEGMCLAHPDIYRRLDEAPRVIARANSAQAGKVGLVSGGGSGHLPVFTGYVGHGLLDTCAIGDVFASPPADDVAVAIRAASHGAGVVNIFGNYGGDIMNFDMAAELLDGEGIDITTVIVADDVASASYEEREKRRGVAGMVLTFKIAGAAAEAMLPLAEVERIARKAADGCRSMGVAMSPCTLPQLGKPTFTIGDDEMEVGMGIHGEAGVQRTRLAAADDIADAMLDPILKEVPLGAGDRVTLLVNSLGATPAEELYIVYRRVAGRLADLGVSIVRPLVGRYATSMEMTGVSLTLLALDDELDGLLSAPATCAFWRV